MKKQKKNRNGSPARPSAQREVRGAATPRKKQNGGMSLGTRVPCTYIYTYKITLWASRMLEREERGCIRIRIGFALELASDKTTDREAN